MVLHSQPDHTAKHRAEVEGNKAAQHQAEVQVQAAATAAATATAAAAAAA